MNALNFRYCETPVIMCEENGKVIEKNVAAANLRPLVRKGSTLNLAPALQSQSPVLVLPQGRCFVIPFEGAIWLLFCDFLRFNFDGAVFPTTLEALMLAGTDLLKTMSLYSSVKEVKSQSQVRRLRQLLYDKFAFIFRLGNDPFRIHSTANLLKTFQKVFPAKKILFTHDGGSYRLVNTRNAVILTTSLISAIMPHTRGRVKVDAVQAGNDLRITVSAATTLPLEGSLGDSLMDLCAFLPEYSADLFTADLCIEACEYTSYYETTCNGNIELTVYIKTETDLYELLNPEAKIPFERDLAYLVKKFT